MQEMFKTTTVEISIGALILEPESHALICAIENKFSDIRNLLVADMKINEDEPFFENFAQNCNSPLKHEDMETKIIPFCYSVISLVDSVLLPSSRSHRATVQFQWLKGDAIALLAELVSIERSHRFICWALDTFQICVNVSKKSLRPYSYHRLGSVLREAKFVRKVSSDDINAYLLASKGLNEALSSLWLESKGHHIEHWGSLSNNVLNELTVYVNELYGSMEINVHHSFQTANISSTGSDST